VQVAAQAKINLRLRILARESAGYHQLETLFLRLELADTVRVRRTSGERTLDVLGDADAAALGPVERNLAWRAAEAYLRYRAMDGGFGIEIEKRIPIGGGLGGGSADAAAVLRALDAMADEPLSDPELLRIAAALGADVPFLTTSDPYALAWGRGERMLALPPLPSRAVLLIVPGFGVNTAQAYRWLAASRDAADFVAGAEPSMIRPGSLSEWDAVAALAENDFQPVVARRHPAIGEHVAALQALECVVSMMSGSGSTVFGVGNAPDFEFSVEDSAGPPGDPTRYLRTRSATQVESLSVIE
jgi:4-diphosphocytidyl-2-C-methyl-D-erythritol kinase